MRLRSTCHHTSTDSSVNINTCTVSLRWVSETNSVSPCKCNAFVPGQKRKFLKSQWWWPSYSGWSMYPCSVYVLLSYGESRARAATPTDPARGASPWRRRRLPETHQTTFQQSNGARWNSEEIGDGETLELRTITLIANFFNFLTFLTENGNSINILSKMMIYKW